MSATLPIRRSTDRIDARTKLYTRYANVSILVFVLLMVIFAGSGFSISNKVEAHSQAISADRAILQFICDDMQNEDKNRQILHVAERQIHATTYTTGYWIALNHFMIQEDSNAMVRQQKCAQLAKDSQ